MGRIRDKRNKEDFKHFLLDIMSETEEENNQTEETKKTLSLNGECDSQETHKNDLDIIKEPLFKTEIQKSEVDWIEIKNTCRSTVNKDDTDTMPSNKFKYNLLISEHSPIRQARIKWRWKNIKSWIVGHFVRHHIGTEKWVSTQRSDRTGVDRHTLPQDAPVTLEMEANAQALINISRFRLCYQAAKETREYMEDLKATIDASDNKPLAYAMVPNCIYRCGCPEFKSCGFWEKFKEENKDVDLTDINQRYIAYNKYFNNKFYKM